MTKNGKPHSLPMTPLISPILHRRCEGLSATQKLFKGVSVEHLAEMAMRAGAPKFMLHDLRKMLATVGRLISIDDCYLRKILNHSSASHDVLNKHYVGIAPSQTSGQLTLIQDHLRRSMEANN